MPAGLCAASGIDALSHAVEAYVSALATNFTNSNSLEAIKLIFRYLPRSFKEGKMTLSQEKKCTMHQLLQVWHLLIHSWEFAIHWLTSWVLRLTFLTGSQMQCC